MRVKVCPRCNSPRVTMDSRSVWMGARYICKNCDFSGNLFPEIEVKRLEELKKLKIKKKSELKTVKKKKK